MSGTLSNIKVEPCQVLWGDVDLGFTEGDLQPKFSDKMHKIKAHQYGANEIGAIRIGKSMELSVNLQETSVAQVNSILAASGATAAAVAEVTTITCVADVAGSLNNKYFFINIADDATKYYVWFNINSAGADPALSGYTAVPVTGATGASATTLATAVAAALDALAGIVATSSGAVVTATNAATGGATDASDGNAGVTIAVSTQGVDAVPGWGTSRDFSEVSADCKKLVLHPVVLASTDHSRDFAFWKAYPMLDSIKLAGESQQLVHVKFDIYPDFNRAAAIRWFVFGKNY